MEFKKMLLLILLVSVLMGCTKQNDTPIGEDDEQPPAPPSDDEENEGQVIVSDQTPQTDKTIGEDDEQPPAPPSDDEEKDEEAIASDESDVLPLPPSEEDEIPNIETQPSESNPDEFVGLWRAFSSRLFYDAGGGGAVGSGTGHPLEINEDGTWQLSTSAGKWTVESVELDDWKKWNVESYGPTRKIILENWDDGTADGPAEESDGRVDFFWVIYRTEPPTVSSPGQVQVKYGPAS